jgi:putative transposase
VKKSRYTEEQIAFALKQAELGTPVDEICRKMGVSDVIFHHWRRKYSGAVPTQAARGRERQTQALGSRSVARQGHAAGCA